MSYNTVKKNRLAMEFLEDTDWGNELVEKLIKVEAHQDAKKMTTWYSQGL